MSARDTVRWPQSGQLEALAAARYGADRPALPPLPVHERDNPVLQTLLGHRSVRAFDPAPLEPWVLPWLVAAAQPAPSSSNLQTWSVVAVEDAGRRARLAELVGHQAQVREAPLLLVWLADLARLEGLARDAGQPVEGLNFLDTWLMAVIDAALAAQNAATAAQSLGLGTVYIGAIRNRPEEVAAELGLAPGTFAVFGLVVGHPDPARPAAVKPRLPQAAVLSRERFETSSSADTRAYDDTMQAFYRREQRPQDRWSQHSLARLRGPADLKGRHRLREALLAQGLELR